MRGKLAATLAFMLAIAFAPMAETKGMPKVSGIAGVAYGVTVGVPINIGQKVVSETKRMTGTLEDDFEGHNEPVFSKLRAMIYFMSVPYGVLSGSILGSVHGVGNAFKYGYEQPFSKVSIGLGDDEVAMKTMQP